MKPTVQIFLSSPSSLCVLNDFSHVWLCAALWMVAHQTPLSMGSFQPRDQICIPYISLLHWQTDSSPLALPGKSKIPYILPKILKWYTYECFLYFRALRHDVWIHSVFNPLYFTFDLKCPWKTLIPFLC